MLKPDNAVDEYWSVDNKLFIVIQQIIYCMSASVFTLLAIDTVSSSVQVGELIRKIQDSYVETLEELNWMDDQSKEKAREKVRQSQHRIIQKLGK